MKRYNIAERGKVRLKEIEYIALAEFRYRLRKFQRHMEEQARKAGVNPQHYQLVLALKGLPRKQTPTIGQLAERMQLNHNSMVELVDRCEERGLLRRIRSKSDRREVTLAITAAGEELLRRLGSAARRELRDSGPGMMLAVQWLIRGARLKKPARPKHPQE